MKYVYYFYVCIVLLISATCFSQQVDVLTAVQTVEAFLNKLVMMNLDNKDLYVSSHVIKSVMGRR